jgi:hypothetical protein
MLPQENSNESGVCLEGFDDESSLAEPFAGNFSHSVD